jgi:hypothetical protein
VKTLSLPLSHPKCTKIGSQYENIPSALVPVSKGNRENKYQQKIPDKIWVCVAMIFADLNA